MVLLIPQIGFQKSFTVSVLQSKPSFNVGILKKKLQSKHVCFTSARCDVWGSRPQCGSQLRCKSWLDWCWTLNGSYWSQVGDQPTDSLIQCKKKIIKIIKKNPTLSKIKDQSMASIAMTCIPVAHMAALESTALLYTALLYTDLYTQKYVLAKTQLR